MPNRLPHAEIGRPSAVALKYDKDDSAPRVVAKGYGSLAETIIRTAKDNGLYVHESPELVGLLLQVDLDSHIPPQLYLAVAELLAWLYALEGRDDADLLSQARSSAGSAQAKPPTMARVTNTSPPANTAPPSTNWP